MDASMYQRMDGWTSKHVINEGKEADNRQAKSRGMRSRKIELYEWLEEAAASRVQQQRHRLYPFTCL